MWPVGFFMRALLNFMDDSNEQEYIKVFKNYWYEWEKYSIYNLWEGLPELTNANGQYNNESCIIQVIKKSINKN